jgi:hypothetical protein
MSLAIAPYFYALSENYGAPDEDYLISYAEGRLTHSAMKVYEAVLREGPLNSIDLRRAAGLAQASQSEFAKALTQLQVDFKLLPIGVADAGAWHYSHIYDIVARHYPGLPRRARRITEAAARRKLMRLYFLSVGAARINDVVRIFRWRPLATEETLTSLQAKGSVRMVYHHERRERWYALPQVCT